MLVMISTHQLAGVKHLWRPGCTDSLTDVPHALIFHMHLRRSAGARCILVVEKDAVFQSLVESRLHEQLPCIIITGRQAGFDDRVAWRESSGQQQVPVFVLALPHADSLLQQQ